VREASCDTTTASDAKHSVVDFVVWTVMCAVGAVHDGSEGTIGGTFLGNGMECR
jgi:hypothetical protein